jgi:hypothetical protein
MYESIEAYTGQTRRGLTGYERGVQHTRAVQQQGLGRGAWERHVGLTWGRLLTRTIAPTRDLSFLGVLLGVCLRMSLGA